MTSIPSARGAASDTSPVGTHLVETYRACVLAVAQS
jgi:hypothetical protein